MKIILSGGGTLGSVSPLLAIAEGLREKDKSIQFLWLGTKTGPEEKLVKEYNINFKPIFSGKWRRYFSWQNFGTPFLVILGYFQAFYILGKFRPNVILSAGGFVSVPVVWAAYLFRVPCLIHQEDICPGVANKLMRIFAKKITVTFEESLKYFSKTKTVLTGNPVRKEILSGNREKAIEFFKLEKNLPTILVFGGGAGALELNKITIRAVPKLVEFCQIIHLTGDRMVKGVKSFSRYHSYKLLTREMKEAYAVADLVIARAGLSTLTELSALGKPALIIPLPGTHQEKNAAFFAKFNALIKVRECDLSPELLVVGVRELLEDESMLENLGKNILEMMPRGATEKVVEVIYGMVK